MSKQILLISAGIVHPNLLAQRILKKTLAALPDFSFTRIRHLNEILALDLQAYAGMVLYYHAKTTLPETLQTFIDYVEGGGGVLAVHGASASFKNEDKYYEVLGGRFVGHGTIEHFELVPGSAMDDIFGRGERFLVYDELYRHEYNSDNTIHYYVEIKADDDENNKEPSVWTRTYGTGRVCYCALGHTASALRQPGVQAILQRGLRWISRS